MPQKYFTSEQYTALLPCGETRTFKSESMAKKWTNLHTKRCACCKDAEIVESVRDYTVRLNKQLDCENERIKRGIHTDANRFLFDALNA